MEYHSQLVSYFELIYKRDLSFVEKNLIENSFKGNRTIKKQLFFMEVKKIRVIILLEKVCCGCM